MKYFFNAWEDRLNGRKIRIKKLKKFWIERCCFQNWDICIVQRHCNDRPSVASLVAIIILLMIGEMILKLTKILKKISETEAGIPLSMISPTPKSTKIGCSMLPCLLEITRLICLWILSLKTNKSTPWDKSWE